MAGIAACLFLLSGYAIGVIRGGGGLAAAGYRMYSMNLLAPIDNRSFGLLIKAQARFSEQSEGADFDTGWRNRGEPTISQMAVLGIGSSCLARFRPYRARAFHKG